MTQVFRSVLVMGFVGLTMSVVQAADPVHAQKGETPAFMESIGQAGNALLANGYLDVTLYDGW